MFMASTRAFKCMFLYILVCDSHIATYHGIQSLIPNVKDMTIHNIQLYMYICHSGTHVRNLYTKTTAVIMTGATVFSIRQGPLSCTDTHTHTHTHTTPHITTHNRGNIRNTKMNSILMLTSALLLILTGAVTNIDRSCC